MSRSAGKSVPSDQDLNCSLLINWVISDQNVTSADPDPDVPADLDLHWSHTHKNAYIWRKGL
jgi:hypothetical protein